MTQTPEENDKFCPKHSTFAIFDSKGNFTKFVNLQVGEVDMIEAWNRLHGGDPDRVLFVSAREFIEPLSLLKAATGLLVHLLRHDNPEMSEKEATEAVEKKLRLLSAMDLIKMCMAVGDISEEAKKRKDKAEAEKN